MPNKRDQQKEATRVRIIAAASVVVASRGYAGTSINAVAATMGRPKSAVGHHHFPSKAALASAIVTEQWARWAAVREHIEATTVPGLTRLLTLLLAAAADVRSSTVAVAAVRLLSELREAGLRPPDGPFEWRAYAVEQVRAGIEDGSLRTERRAEEIAAELLNTALGVYEAENRGFQPVDTDAALRRVWADLLAGIDPDAPTMIPGPGSAL